MVIGLPKQFLHTKHCTQALKSSLLNWSEQGNTGGAAEPRGPHLEFSNQGSVTLQE